MTDFKKALEEGLSAAQNINATRAEIQNVLAKLKSELLEASGGSLLVELRQISVLQKFEQKKSLVNDNINQILAMSLNPNSTYTALVAHNQASPETPLLRLAIWKQTEVGYPVYVSWGSEERQCEDRVALEEVLADLLKDPQAGKLLYSILNPKAQ